MSKIGDWEGRDYIHVYRRGLASGILDQLAYHPGTFDSLQELMDITLELDTRYHERQKEKGSNQEKSPPVTGCNSFKPLKIHLQRSLITGRARRGRIFQSQRLSLMLLSSIRTIN
ncbi:hypothetical protein O181_120641 [Austropuccinia psidii MF-1]|uniref:Uncharacterized protein n=1 Tax=Austropuccinia psidii MF-1 TaxID=1389203 RepID=A0A9Q3Q0R4_9BASI|nr:hypothetical protein [Austropuccinia psidii MF-1]